MTSDIFSAAITFKSSITRKVCTFERSNVGGHEWPPSVKIPRYENLVRHGLIKIFNQQK